MSLKNAKNIFSSPASMKTQLTFFYSVSTFILLILIALFLYSAMIKILYNADYQFLSDEIDIIENILEKNPNNLIALKQEIEDVPGSIKSSVYQYYIRIVNHENKAIIETQKMNTIVQQNTFLTTIKNNNKEIYQWWRSAKGGSFLLVQSPFKVGNKNNIWKIQIALDVSYQEKIINNYRMQVIFIIFCGALFSIMLGYIITQKSLQRLYQLTEKTKQITANALQQNIDLKSWPKELNELGSAFNQMLKRIDNSFSRLTGFCDDLAHELRTPLTNIIGKSEITLSHATTVDEYRLSVESTLEETQRINQIIENLLFLARAENPQIDLQKNIVNFNDQMRVLCHFYQALADEKNIHLTCQGDATAAVNVTMLRRMISNIISNSLKYTPLGGQIHLNIEEVDGCFVQLKLSDTGIGISPEHLTKIFTRFYRIDSSRSHDSGGIGLGLSIVKSIVDLHCGTISISSEIDKGTTITIRFPKCLS